MRLKYQPTEPLKQTPHIVAFLDFLGATAKMRSVKDNDNFLQEIYTVYNFANQILEQTEKKRENKLKIKIFSDNIVIAEKIENPLDLQSVFQTYTDVEQFALMLYSQALLTKNMMRGAISMGNLFINDTFVYGEALVAAYDDESKIANYPRIIVDKNIWEKFPRPDKENLVQCDIDGELYLSPFWGIPKISEYDKLKANLLLNHIKNSIEAKYREISKKSNRFIFPKYHWLANQFNQYCQSNNFNFQIDLDKLTLEGKNE